MGVGIYTAETEYATCYQCGDGWEESDMYVCDGCGKWVCQDCLAITEIDCPSEFCEECI